MWALPILCLLLVSGANAMAPSPAPMMSPSMGMSPAKMTPPATASPPTTAKSSGTGMAPRTMTSPVTASPPTTSSSSGTAMAPTVTASPPTTAMSPTAGMAPATDCMTLIYNMSDCLTYVQKGSKTAKPDKGCCPELAGLLDSNPICLCNMLGNSSALPVQLDLNKALKLPSVCSLQTPPVSMCSEVGIPVAAPTSGSAISAESPTSSPGMAMAPGPMGGQTEGPTGGKSGVSTSYSLSKLLYLLSPLAMAFLTL